MFDDTHTLARKELFIGKFASGGCQELLVGLKRGLVAMQLVERNGSQIQIAGDFLAQSTDAIERSQTVVELLGEDQDAGQFVQGGNGIRMQRRRSLKLMRRFGELAFVPQSAAVGHTEVEISGIGGHGELQLLDGFGFLIRLPIRVYERHAVVGGGRAFDFGLQIRDGGGCVVGFKKQLRNSLRGGFVGREFAIDRNGLGILAGFIVFRAQFEQGVFVVGIERGGGAEIIR